ncbi:unnamed protein product [Ectocarpus sp. 6 AP-2014]
MQAAVWGPVGWKFLHCVAHGFPEDPVAFDATNGKQTGTTAANYTRFFALVGHVLPCRYCRDSYQAYIAETPPATSSRATLTKWLWDIHNKVNTKLDVKYSGAGYDSIYNTYDSYRAKCVDPSSRGCTTPEGHHTRKRATVVVRDVGAIDKKMVVILVFATFVIVAALTKWSQY